MKKAVYVGSFDPWTIGHQDIALQALQLFDELHILIAKNSRKTRRVAESVMEETINNLFAGYDNVHVVICEGLVTDYCDEHDIDIIIRGSRSLKDHMEDEDTIKAYKRLRPSVIPVVLYGTYDFVSSSLIWELHGYGKPIDDLLPYPLSYIL